MFNFDLPSITLGIGIGIALCLAFYHLLEQRDDDDYYD